MTAPTSEQTKPFQARSKEITSNTVSIVEYIAVILCGSAGARMFPLSRDMYSSSKLDSFYNSDEDNDKEDDHVSDEIDNASIQEKDGANSVKNSSEEEYKPKHLLPVAGIPILHRLLLNVRQSGFEKCIIACSAMDEGATLASVQSMSKCTPIDIAQYSNTRRATLELKLQSQSKKTSKVSGLHITILDLPSTCDGSCEALQYLAKNELSNYPLSHVLVMPSDLILDTYINTPTTTTSKNDNNDILGSLVSTHRKGYEEKKVAVTMLLSDVGDEDEKMLPLKESAKQKKGGLTRDEEDIEYIALSTYITSQIYATSSKIPRVILKRRKFDVEENEDNDGDTSKLEIPKYRLRDDTTTNTITTLTTDLSDLHVYIFAPWVIQCLIQMRKGVNSIQGELIPLLITRQFRGVKSALGKQCFMNAENKTLYQRLISSPPFGSATIGTAITSANTSTSSTSMISNANDEDNNSSIDNARMGLNNSKSDLSPKLFYCAAYILPREVTTTHPRLLTLRASTVPSYLYACREMVMNAVSRNTPNNIKNLKVDSKSSKTGNNNDNDCASSLPEGSQIQAKFNSLILPNTTVGEKLRLQNSTVGANCKIGAKCKLNNVVVMDNVVIGDNCTLQNSVIGTGVIMGENCSLNDCQIGHGFEMSSGTKLKGESLTNY